MNNNAHTIKQPPFVPSDKQSPLPSHINYGEMTEEDAKTSGYTDQKGHAVSMAKKDVPGSPTGAYTDVGAGRSSVVKSGEAAPGSASKPTIEKAPKPRGEGAP